MKTIAVPESLTELFQDPQRVRDAFALLNALATVEVHLVPPGNVAALSPGNQTLRGDPPKLIMPLPLQFTRTIANSSATVASVSAQLNLVLDELRKNKQLPS